MCTRPLPLLHVTVISLPLFFIALAWSTVHVPLVNAEDYCWVPKMVGELPGGGARPRWANSQRVRVVAYPGHFTGQEITTMNNILNEFEPGGRSVVRTLSFLALWKKS